jgi:segregation and condensation protein B
MTVTGDVFPAAPRSADGDDEQVSGGAGGTSDDSAGWASDDEAPPASRAAGYAPAATWVDEDDEAPVRPAVVGPDDEAVLDDYSPAERGDDFIADTVAEEQPESEQRMPITAFEEIASSWVPPWARSQPELLIEPASDNLPEEELAVGRLAYAEPDDLPNPDDFEPGLGEPELRGALEAILMVVDEPVPTTMLAQVLEEPTSRIEEMLRSLAQDYAGNGRGFELRTIAGGWRFYTRGEYAGYVERFVLDGQQIRLTQAALETLAVVAYKQPVSRSRVAAIRGVNCDGVMKTLVTRGLIEECGTEDNGAHIYRTTRLFLEKIGVNSVADLPSLGPFLPDNINEMDFAQL